jgi:uncharacterized protein involved in copper resistance
MAALESFADYEVANEWGELIRVREQIKEGIRNYHTLMHNGIPLYNLEDEAIEYIKLFKHSSLYERFRFTIWFSWYFKFKREYMIDNLLLPL